MFNPGQTQSRAYHPPRPLLWPHLWVTVCGPAPAFQPAVRCAVHPRGLPSPPDPKGSQVGLKGGINLGDTGWAVGRICKWKLESLTLAAVEL